MALRAVASRPGGATTVSAAQPTLPWPGDLWWNLDDVKMYVWDGAEWVVTVNTPEVTGGAGGGELPEAPTDGRVYGRNGQLTSWQAVNPIIATGSTTQRMSQDRAADVINVRDFGALGNGTADDTAAINAALNYVRTVVGNAPAGHGGYCLVFPYGRYRVTSPLNFTNIATFGVIDGQGSEIWGQMAGGAVVDCLGSRFLHFRDLSVWGDPTTTPAIGIQVGRYARDVVADDHNFYDVNVWGNFTFAALYNFAAESTPFVACSFRNNATGNNRFCVVQDGVNYWGATSSFVTVTAPTNTSESFNENAFYGCIFQGNGSNGVVWMANTNRHKYDRCYASCPTGTIFMSFGLIAGTPAQSFLDIDCHCETTGLQYAFTMTAAPGATYSHIESFTFEDHACYAATSILSIDQASSLTTVELRNARLRIVQGGGVTPALFDIPSRWVVRAAYAALGPSSMWAVPQVWSGPVEDLNNPAASFTTISGPVTFGDPNGSGTTLLVKAAAGNPRRLQFFSSNAERWQVETSTDAESGGNAGSNFYISAFNDAGGFLSQPFRIYRNSGLISIQNGVYLAGGDLQVAAGNLLLSNLVNAANDAGAAGGGVPIDGVYRNGSQLMVRVT